MIVLCTDDSPPPITEATTVSRSYRTFLVIEFCVCALNACQYSYNILPIFYTPGFISSHKVRIVTQFDQLDSVWHFTAAGRISALVKTARECVNNKYLTVTYT